MSEHTPLSRDPIDTYLANMREELAGLPPDDVTEILRELRGHIAERAAGSGTESIGASVEQVLRQLGAPEQIASLYRTDAQVAHARSSFSPRLIVRTTIRWASKTLLGFTASLAGVVGYAVGASLIVCAVLKPVFPANIGLWINPHGMTLGAEVPKPHGHELLGWWIIPYGLGVGIAFILGTTVFLRWMLRFVPRASRRAPTAA